MASPLLLLHLLLIFFFLSISISNALTSNSPQFLTLPITKDTNTLQYITQIYHGTPNVPMNLVLDLGGRFLWFDCHSGYVSSTYRPVQCRSIQCSTADSHHCTSTSPKPGSSDTGPGSGCYQNSCALFPHNTITRSISIGELSQDVVAVQTKDGSIIAVDDFLFSCAPKFLLNNLANGAKGMVGLGRNRIALPLQLAGKFGFHRKFALCLPSTRTSQGYVALGDVPYILNSNTDVSKSFMLTPFNGTQSDSEYYIGVKSIKIDGHRLPIDSLLVSADGDSGRGGTELSTVIPYTTLKTSIYKVLTQTFINMASNNYNMTRTAPLAPFDVCFISGNIGDMRHGPAVPVIELVLQSEMVIWRIYGKNSMVRVSDEVLCLGVLDGGLNPKSSIVIGGHQMEDNLLEFDLGTSMLGFSSSLLIKGTSCSNLNFHQSLGDL